MRGEIVYVKRKPLGFGSIKPRLNPKSSIIDRFIFRFLPYKHYGIDLGNNQIIHFYCPSILLSSKATVSRCTMKEFLKDGTLEVESLPLLPYKNDEIARRAESMVDTDFGGYKIKSNNCEHFSMWCATGVASSKQDLLRAFYQKAQYLTLSFVALRGYNKSR